MRRHLPSLAIGALVGAAVAVLVYRYVALPWDASGTTTTILVGAAIGALVASGTLRKGAEPEPSWPARLAGAPVGAAAAVGLCALLVPGAGDLPLKAYDLPGFSIALPDGKVARWSVDYRAGQVAIDRPAGWRVVTMVGWEIGAVDDELDEAAVTAFAAAFAGKGNLTVRGRPALRVGDHRAGSVELGGDLTMLLTYVECGVRVVTIATAGRPDLDVAGLHRRVLASFRCTPDEEQEFASAVPPPVRFALPDGWALVVDAPGERVWEGEDGSGVLARWAPAGSLDHLPAVLQASYATVDGPARVAPAAPVGGHRAFAGEVTLDGEALALVTVVVPCGARPALVTYLGTDGDAGRALLATARCE